MQPSGPIVPLIVHKMFACVHISRVKIKKKEQWYFCGKSVTKQLINRTILLSDATIPTKVYAVFRSLKNHVYVTFSAKKGLFVYINMLFPNAIEGFISSTEVKPFRLVTFLTIGRLIL